MAKKYPEILVIGIDVVPVPMDPESLPPNLQFEIDDFGLGLTHFQGQFDLIHSRLITSGMKNARKSLMDIHSCLKPGGLMIWIEPDYLLFTSDPFTYAPIASEANPTGSWTARLAYGKYQGRERERMHTYSLKRHCKLLAKSEEPMFRAWH